MQEAEKAQSAYAALYEEAKVARKVSVERSQQAENAQHVLTAITQNAKRHDTNANRQAILDWLRRYGNPVPVEAH